MPREKPKPSQELVMLRTVMILSVDDVPNPDPEMLRYQELMKTDPKWILTQRRQAEKEYREEVAAWQKEQSERTAKRKKKTEAVSKEPCEVLVSRMLDEWDKVK